MNSYHENLQRNPFRRQGLPLYAIPKNAFCLEFFDDSVKNEIC